MARIEARDIVMQFPAVRALDGVSVTFEPGKVHAIIGENGAGKSTLMRILAGLQQPTSGTLVIDARNAKLPGPAAALEHGISMIHQELNLVDELSVAANIFLGREKLKAGALDDAAMAAAAQPYLTQLEAPFSPRDQVGNLTIASKQLVEIAKALACEASVLIMDEPTAVLSAAESKALINVIRLLKHRGTAVIYISHRLAEVDEIADDIAVLRDGRLVRQLQKGEATPSDMASLMVGRPIGELFPARTPIADTEPVVLEVSALRVEGEPSVSLQVRRGEIVGLAGLVGAGRTELAEAIAGVRNYQAGSVSVNGKELRRGGVQSVAEAGVAYVSEDRKDLGLLLSLGSVVNATLANLDKYATPFLRPVLEREATESWVEKLRIRIGDLDAPAMLLSGGNQQKLAVAKWLDRSPDVLILDEPTRGVDVGAKAEMYKLIADLATQGLACLVISSELNELIGLCHRILVIRGGSIVGELPGEDATEERLMALAAGVAA